MHTYLLLTIYTNIYFAQVLQANSPPNYQVAQQVRTSDGGHLHPIKLTTY